MSYRDRNLINKRVIIKNFPRSSYSGLRGRVLQTKPLTTVQGIHYQVHFAVSELQVNKLENDIWFTEEQFVIA